MHCKLPETGLFNILTALEETASLLVLDFKSTFIPDSLTSIITNIICKSLQLEELNLSECSLHKVGWTNILTALSILSSLKFIDLSHLKCHYSVNHGNEYWHCINNQNSLLTSIIIKNQSLEYLNIAYCKVIKKDFVKILNSLSQLKSIKYLDISGNIITQEIIGYVINVIRSNTKVEYLNVSNCYIKNPEFLSSLNECIYLMLDISHNALEQYDMPMSQVNRYLDINFHKLTEKNITHFDKYIERLPYLKHLNFSHNMMNKLSAERIALAIANSKSLEYLNISECGLVDLRTILVSVQRNSMLKSLILRSNDYFVSRRMKATYSADGNSSCLEHLDLSNCKLWEVERFNTRHYNYIMNDIVSIVSCNMYLIKLNFSHCELSESQLTIIVKAFNNLLRLKYLDISLNKVSPKIANELAYTLTTNPVLQHLNLSGCELSTLHITCTGIVEALRQKGSYLIFLDISHNTETDNKSDEIASLIMYNPLLKHLNLANCELSELQLISIYKALTKTSLLTFLDISHKKMSTNASDELASVISCNPLLEHLNISKCDLSEIQHNIFKTVSLLTFLDISHNTVTNNVSDRIVTYNPLLEHLNLAYCKLSELQLFSIFKTLTKTSLLTFLDISQNKMSNNASDELSSVISCNPLLEHLNISKCDLSEVQLISIFKGLKKTSLLKFLDISHNRTTNNRSDEIASVVINNPLLEHLNLANCELSELQLILIFKALKKHHC